MVFKRDNPHYRAIQAYYGEQRAKRSGLPYLRHIDEGLAVLEAIGATLRAREAYCLHPIVQADDAVMAACGTGSVLLAAELHPQALLLAMEYRWIANLYLSSRTLTDISEIQLGPLPEVRQMLIADKVQNRKDFELHHQGTHPRSAELTEYFQNWLARLGISEARYQELKRLLIDGLGQDHRFNPPLEIAESH